MVSEHRGRAKRLWSLRWPCQRTGKKWGERRAAEAPAASGTQFLLTQGRHRGGLAAMLGRTGDNAIPAETPKP